MSPEQVRGVDVDHRTDVYAFGVILYELLTGTLPFQANTYGALVLQIVLEAPPPLQKLAPELPPSLIKIVNQAMARNPEERFQSLEALAQVLEPFALGRTPPPEPNPFASVMATPVPSTPPRRMSQRPDPLRAPEVSVATPLSSEFDPELPEERRGRGLMWTALSVGLALVIGGGFVALRMTGTRAGNDSPETRTAASAGREDPTDATPKKARDPEVERAEAPRPPPSVVVLPAAQPAAEGWQTPPEAAQPKPGLAADTARLARERARAEAEAEAARERAAERSASRSSGRRGRNKRSPAEEGPPAPPAPPASTKPVTASKPTETNKPTGRLGVSLEETDF
jgi:hypothetical protein